MRKFTILESGEFPENPITQKLITRAEKQYSTTRTAVDDETLIQKCESILVGVLVENVGNVEPVRVEWIAALKPAIATAAAIVAVVVGTRTGTGLMVPNRLSLIHI